LILSILFFIGFFLYLRFKVDPTLYFQFQNPAFFMNFEFLKEFLRYPGGMAEYVSLFLTTLCDMPWAGTAIITALAISITMLTVRLLKSFGIDDTYATLSLIPAIVLIGLHGNYGHRIQYDVMLMAMLIAYSIYRSHAPRVLTLNIVFQISISGLLLYLAGLIPFCLLMSMILIENAIAQKGRSRIVHIASGLLITFSLPYLYYNVAFMRSIQFEKELFQSLLTGYTMNYVPLVPLLFYPVTAISVPLFKKTAARFRVKKTAGTKNETNPLLRDSISLSVQLGIIAASSALSFMSMYDVHYNRLLRIQKLSDQNKWNEAVDLSAQCAPNDMLIHLMRNRALYHSGQLLDHLFDYPQRFGVRGLMFTGDGDTRQFIAFNDLAYDLGEINQSIRWSYEEVSSFGHCPHALKRLASANIVKENYATAKKMLTMLQQAPLQKQYANAWLARLECPAVLNHETDIMDKRSLLPRNIYSDRNNVEHMTILVNLFYNNKNRMAFEYLLTSLLLEKNLDEFVKYLSFLKEFGYNGLPRHIQEALCIYSYTRPDGKKLVEQYPVNPTTMQQFLQFTQIMYQYGQQSAQGKDLLQRRFGNTYWYYLRYIYPDIVSSKKAVPNRTQDDLYIQKAGR
jgi:hypothetical protein